MKAQHVPTKPIDEIGPRKYAARVELRFRGGVGALYRNATLAAPFDIPAQIILCGDSVFSARLSESGLPYSYEAEPGRVFVYDEVNGVERVH